MNHENFERAKELEKLIEGVKTTIKDAEYILHGANHNNPTKDTRPFFNKTGAYMVRVFNHASNSDVHLTRETIETALHLELSKLKRELARLGDEFTKL